VGPYLDWLEKNAKKARREMQERIIETLEQLERDPNGQTPNEFKSQLIAEDAKLWAEVEAEWRKWRPAEAGTPAEVGGPDDPRRRMGAQRRKEDDT
jgi:hypothetical protein